MKLILHSMSKKEKGMALLAMALIVVQVLLETWIPSQTSAITTLIQNGEGSMDAVTSLGLRMILGAAAAFLCACAAGYLISVVGCGSCGTIRQRLFEKVVGFSVGEVSSIGPSSLLVRCTNDVTYVQRFVQECLQPLAQAPILLIAVFLRMSFANPVWIWMGVAAVSVMLGVLVYILLSTMIVFRKSGKVRDKIASVTREHVLGIRVLHAFNAQVPYAEEYEKTNRVLTGFHEKSKKILASFSPVISALLYALSVAIYVIGAFLISGTPLGDRLAAYSQMVAYVSYVALLISALVNIILVVLYVPQVMYANQRIFTVLSTPGSITDGQTEEEKTEDAGTLEFRNVSFRYPLSPEDALSDISFRVEEGQTAAIIGATGSGKTTLLNLIPRLRDVREGEVLVGGVNVKDYRLSSLRGRIGYVPQVSFLFAGTVRSNIGYGEKRAKATAEQIEDAARTGQAEEFILQKEDQYDAAVQTAGANFSGGQRQRLAISRAICRNPEILLFDDSFSALDYQTDSRLRKEMKKHAAGATVLIVSQRISTIRDADVIFVMDKGRIVGRGTHEELIENCAVYREFVQSQEREQVAG